MQKICVVIPCFNEEHRFLTEAFLSFSNTNTNFSFLLVNDGSTDNTLALLQKLALTNSSNITVLSYEKNRGKAEAVRQGFLTAYKSKFDYIGFIDADFSAPLEEFNTLLSYCNTKLTHAIISGSRIKRLGATVIRNPLRHYMGRVFATVASSILLLPIYDSQCGLKLIRKEVVLPLFQEPFLTKWLFDLEIWLRLRNYLTPEKIEQEALEVPLNEWKEKANSKIRYFDILKVPFYLLKIHLKYNRSV